MNKFEYNEKMSENLKELFDSTERLTDLANEARKALKPITPAGMQWIIIPCAPQINTKTKDVRLFARAVYGTEGVEHDMMPVALLASLVSAALQQIVAEETSVDVQQQH